MFDYSAEKPTEIVLQDLSYSAGQTRLIDIPQTTFNASGITVVMGPNGAGKSLLLRLMHGMIPPTTGRILYGAYPLDTAMRRQQALVFQTPVLLRRTALANLQFACKVRGTPLTQTDRLLETVGLGDKADTPARQLSGGEKQRLALAQALATHPRTLFLDEPTASLDPASTRSIEDIVTQVSASGLQVIFVTHDTAQARRLADHVVFLSQGRVTDQAPADVFFDNPASQDAQAYLEGRLPR
jgi:tungstate transport system ATP-binding protein